MTASVTHFEIYTEELTKLAGFYQELFEWKIDKAPGIEYFQIETGPAEAGGIRGGILHRPIPGPRSWVHYVSVASVDETVERVQRLGGKLGTRQGRGAEDRLVRRRRRPRRQRLRHLAGRRDRVPAARARGLRWPP